MDDYKADTQFGQWLKDLRNNSGLTIEQASDKARLSPQRLKALEVGYSERGITKNEAKSLSDVYKVELKEIIARASVDD